jgi:G:T-mismatch repair DNA endonuclease (very short patch repair protein)
MAAKAKTIGKPLKQIPQLGKHGKKPPQPDTQRAKVDVRARVSPSYAKIKEQVLGAIANLPGDEQQKIPMAGTLPEIMVALALVWLGWHFDSQSSELGGRLYLGGSVIDFKIYLGTGFIACRVNGDYWHSLQDRIYKDAVQWTRLHAMGYRVADLLESDIYKAWVDNRLKAYVEESILNAT